ncbi:hypothetical protein KJ885_02795 [Patescibacteria group bacterium]|nr:hypothetical protein [Patescibacteria group bacterium]
MILDKGLVARKLRAINLTSEIIIGRLISRRIFPNRIKLKGGSGAKDADFQNGH